MSLTTVQTVQDQVQQFWSPLFQPELREETILPSLVNRKYEGEIKKKGDTVKVSQIKKATGELLDIPAGEADVFHPEKLVTVQVEIKADKRAVASFKIAELAEIQSQIGDKNSEIREALMQGVMEQLNDFLYSIVAPSAANPDHTFPGVATFAATDLSQSRRLAGKSKWNKKSAWWALLDPDYYGDLLDEQTITSSDFNGGEQVTIAGEIVNKRYGFNIVEDNSRDTPQGLLFEPDFIYLVTQKTPTFKISDQHANEEFAFLISLDMIFGAIIGIEGDVKHIQFTA